MIDIKFKSLFVMKIDHLVSLLRLYLDISQKISYLFKMHFTKFFKACILNHKEVSIINTRRMDD
ncbi:hypothetical protein CLI91_04570 [Lentilactobacillus hilgardii]|uniref:Uncharacterized protein n=1 Tax=Lentilactobacillus hilgardii TaxID=1588 RepID=A0A6P1EC44_LENHI|nr:hypothetical protein [Lentilactobacillus hilgardii]MBZ2203303.1 hypothetical protein [Lentilactobacillus hilgardii]MCT3392024.1 hypothetical protein [Lentilactobacillus hilgardii]QHB53382.1 hypothetical protein GQR93_05180 [Lentilactobacillus hilgardii]RRG12405.1 MAG: hypothetical protein DUD35_02195 [Lactobacillus sp.]